MTLVFRVLKMPTASPQEWLARWAEQYDVDNGDDQEYAEIINRHAGFGAEDFRRIGMWKDGIATEVARAAKWKENVASVAFLIWEQAASERPGCPAGDEGQLREFLERWSARTYTDTYSSGVSRSKRFGLSRATTLLHFLSGGFYPIFDSRVRVAIARLTNEPEMDYTLGAYLDGCIPKCRELASLCHARNIREVDKALFSYGALNPATFRSAPY